MPGLVSTGMGDHIKVQLTMWKINLALTNHPRNLSPAIPQWVGAMSTGERAVILCSWGVKAGMDRVWWQVKLCDPLYNTYLSALEAELLRLSAIQIHVYFNLYMSCLKTDNDGNLTQHKSTKLVNHLAYLLGVS